MGGAFADLKVSVARLLRFCHVCHKGIHDYLVVPQGAAIVFDCEDAKQVEEFAEQATTLSPHLNRCPSDQDYLHFVAL